MAGNIRDKLTSHVYAGKYKLVIDDEELGKIFLM